MSEFKERKTTYGDAPSGPVGLLDDEELFGTDDFLAEFTAAQVSDLTGVPQEEAAPRRSRPAPPPEVTAPAREAEEASREEETEAAPAGKKPPKKQRSGQEQASLRHILFDVAEIVLIVFLAAYVAWIFLKDTSKDVDMNDIAATVAQECQLGDLEEGDANTLKRYFSLDGAEYEGYIVYTADSVMNVDELLIVKVSDSSQLGTLETVVNNRLEEQIRNFDGYGTNQSELLQNAIILERGDYFFYGVSENVEQWEDVFLSCIK